MKNKTLAKKYSMSWTMFWYILSETMFSFSVSFLFFFFIFFVNQLLLLAQDILSKHVPFQQVALLILYSVPSIIALSAPFASLMGTLMTIGRLSSDNEVLVMLTSGLSYSTLFMPALIIGLVVSGISFFTNDVLLPAGTLEFSKLYRRIAISTPALELASNTVKRFNDTVLVTGEVSGTSIGDILILDKTETGERRLIMAKEAELKDGGHEGLNLELDNAFIQSSKELARTDYDYAHADFLRYWIPQNDIMQSTTTITSGQMSSVDVLGKIRSREADIQAILNERYGRNLVYALNLEAALRKGPLNDAWNRLPNQLTNFTREILAINTIRNDRNLSLDWLEFYKKFSLPLGALSFVFLAVPLGMLARKRGQALGFFFALIISFLYWALLLFGQSSGIRLNFSPFWSMWLPDILSVVAGSIMLLYRIRR